MPSPSSLPRNPPFRAEHLGSLLRPKALLQTRKAVEEKKTPASELEPIENESIDSIVKTQLDLGYRAITDGEYR